MGKPYEKELEKLNSTYEWALNIPINGITSFVKDSQYLPMLAIGSGGSLTSAIFSSLLHQKTGTVSQYFTPFESIFLDYSFRKLSVLIISAGGRNSDIISTFKQLIKKEPQQIMSICGTSGSPLSLIVKDFNYARLYEMNLPSGKDGFLATNSLLAYMVILSRAYNDCLSLSLEFPKTLNSLVHPQSSKKEFIIRLKRKMEPLLKKNTIVVLYGKWGKPAAFDLESKLTEAALVNVQLADYRNFAHGRHHWLSKNGERTGIVCLVTSKDKDISNRTLNLIPNDIPKIQLSTDYSGPIATLDLIVKVMYLVNIVGKSKNIDPGRPGVPQFGSRIYRLRINSSKNRSKQKFGFSSTKTNAISRKIGYQLDNTDENKIIDYWSIAYNNYLDNIEKNRFGALVCDYDGTLCDRTNRDNGASKEIGDELIRLLKQGIIFGVATGRGKSIRNDFRRIIPHEYWDQILIGYYNGADIGLLNDEKHPNKNLEMDPTLSKFTSFLQKNELINQLTKYECRPKQLTFESIGSISLKRIIDVLRNLAFRNNIKGLQILESSHSVDVLSPKVSKLDLVKDIEKMAIELGKPSAVLCIGDKGKWPGNDFALLSKQNSLSVDTVSLDPNSCWNLASEGQRGVQVTLNYLKAIEISNNAMIFKYNR